MDDGRGTGGNATNVDGECIHCGTLSMQRLPIVQAYIQDDTMSTQRLPTLQAYQRFHRATIWLQLPKG